MSNIELCCNMLNRFINAVRKIAIAIYFDHDIDTLERRILIEMPDGNVVKIKIDHYRFYDPEMLKADLDRAYKLIEKEQLS